MIPRYKELSPARCARVIAFTVTFALCHAFALVGCGPAPVRHFQMDGADSVVTASFVHDDKLVAAGTADGSVGVWDVATGRGLARAENFTRADNHDTKAVAFSPDGTHVAFATAHGVRLWDWRNGRAQTLVGHALPPHGVAFTRDGRVIVAVSGGLHYVPATEPADVPRSTDARRRQKKATRQPLWVTTWDAASGEPLSRVEDDTSGALDALIAPDGQRYAASCVEGLPRRFDAMARDATPRPRVRFCDVATGTTHAAVDVPAYAWRMSFSPDAKLLFATRADGGAVYEVDTGRQVCATNFSYAVFTDGGRALLSIVGHRVAAFHPGQLLVPVAGHERMEWRVTRLDLDSGRRREQRVRPRDEDARDSEPLAFSNDRQFFVDRRMRLWRVPR